MLKMYIGELRGESNLPVLLPNTKVYIKDRWLFVKKAFAHYKEPVFDLASVLKDADFLLIPYNYFSIKNDKEYIDRFINLSKQHNKTILIFAYGDSAEEINIPNSLIFRPSQYKFRKKGNEIIMPGYTEDLSDYFPISFRQKSEVPMVGFCGWADFPGFKAKIKYYLKIALNQDAERQGLYFRRQALGLLSKSDKVKTNFIIRKSYSGHSQTIELPEEKAREEYINNIVNSDFVLSVKGDGNFSYRFYEALSLGRLPLLVDTDSVLPLEDIINYRDFVAFVDYRDMDRIAETAKDYWDHLDDDLYAYKQKLAREAFERYLRIDKYFELMFKQRKVYDYLK